MRVDDDANDEGEDFDSMEAPSLQQRASVQLWRWRFVGPGPHLTNVLRVGEQLRAAATRVSFDQGSGALPDEVHRDPDREHGNAFWLPGDEDGDGLIDHAWVYREGGLPRVTIAALASVGFVRVGGRKHLLEPEWMSPRVSGGPFGPARVWRSLTPYVTPRWRLSKTGRERLAFTPDAQLVSEMNKRGLPPVASIAWESVSWIGEGPVMASSFLMSRRKPGDGGQPPGDAVASFPTVTFSEPVLGPMAFGFGAHFGLGQLVPLEV